MFILLSLSIKGGGVTRGSKCRGKKSDLLAIETQDRLHDALKLLFELLEKYAPVWYEKKHHDQAESALNLSLLRKRKLTLVE